MDEEIKNKFLCGLPLTMKESLYLFDKYIESLEQEPCEDCISLNKLDDIITKAIDESENQTECQTLRWVLDVMSELTSVVPSYNSVNTELKPRTNFAETSQDTISREALRQKLQDHHDFFVNAYGNFRGMSLSDKARVDEIDNCIAMVVNAPSVTSQPKVGKWIKTYETNDAEPYILWECSECKNVERGKRTKYCPNCGSYNGGGNE